MRRLVALGSLSSCLLGFAACGSANHAGPAGSPGAAGTSLAGNGAGGANGSSGGTTSIGLSGNANGANAGTTGLPDKCAETSQSGQLVPLDLYVMLDKSGSMTDVTGTGAQAPTKWAAVTQALEAFFNDKGSDGLGVGLQFFPQMKANIPDSCTSNAECGDAAPCFLKFCQNAGPGLYPCDRASDCVQGGDDYGPCTPIRYCWDAFVATGDLTGCHFDEECATGRCVPFNHCSANPDYLCPTAGQDCGEDNGKDLGNCGAFNPPSVCVDTTSCTNADYATPAATIATLPGAAPALVAAIAAQDPSGNTPTSAALTGAIAQAKAYAAAHTDHTVAVVLATDGLPTECLADPAGDPSGITQVASIARTGFKASPPISTFVIGVFGPDDTDASANLDQIASSGGTEKAFLIDTSGKVSMQFLVALNSIRQSQLGCEYQLPEPPAGQDLDPSRINVDLKSGGQTTRLFGVANEAACGGDGGRYYDDANKPTKILICPATCSTFESATETSISIALGCTTVVR